MGIFATPAVAVDDPPPPPNYDACAISGGFWNGIGVMNYRMDADYQYLKFYNCPLPAPWAPQDVYKVSVNYVVNPDNDDSYTTTRLDFCLSSQLVLDLGAGGHHSGSRYRNGAAILPIAMPRKDSSCSPADNPPVPPVGPPSGPPPGSPPAPPTVNITGTVVAPRHMSADSSGDEPMRSLPGALWELWYEGKAGNENDPVEWRPVLTEGSSGVPLTGYLDDDGRFVLNFIYPQRYVSADGTTWHGCDLTDIAYMRSNACADDKLQLRIYPENSDASVMIVEPGQINTEPMMTIALGLHFQREDGADHEASEPAAHAYAAAYNVRDLVGGNLLGKALITFVENGGSYYDPETGVVVLERGDAADFTVEHELGHHLLHRLFDEDYLDWYRPNCVDHFIYQRSSPDCAFSEGFANWIAVLAENEPGETSWTKIVFNDGSSADLESRALSDGTRFESGPAVEGNIAAALFDLVDSSPEEKRFSLIDSSSVPLHNVLTVIGEAEPHNFDEFYDEWVTFLGTEDDAMTFWLNTLHFAAMEDARTAGAVGAWETEACSECFLGDVAVAKDPKASMNWLMGMRLQDFTMQPDLWNVWVYIPAGNGLDEFARYQVLTKSGPIEFTVDQNANQGRWALLNPDDGVSLDTEQPVSITLTYGSESRFDGKLHADGVMITPRRR
ncbi:hypothetical protein [Catellatospora sp. NPDC049609]|uniref:hypothetical protein n=1 Tax=Catellatospora sp. NPDC049609 TaxID=3155505 RepID=UPI003431F8E9